MSSPDLTAVISTHRRPGPLREAIAAILDQDADVSIETVVVFDKEEPDTSLESDDPRRPVRVIPNHRTPGLPGSRNSGVDAAGARSWASATTTTCGSRRRPGCSSS
jgi:glycosyltransferase involved in cell wall biosynthesis